MVILIMSELLLAFNVSESASLVISLLVWPVPLATLITLGIKCFREKRLLGALPLLATQLISGIIWGCLGALEVGSFLNIITGAHFIKSNQFSLKHFMISYILENQIYLEPLNLLLYTQQFLHELEQEEKNTFVKKFYKWFARISIFLFPTAFFCIVPAYICEETMHSYYLHQF